MTEEKNVTPVPPKSAETVVDVNGFTADQKWAAACYIPAVNLIICLIAAVRKVDSKYVLLHARQGLVLFGGVVIANILAFVSPILSQIVWIAVLILHVVGIVMIVIKSKAAMPFVDQLALKIPERYLAEMLTGEKKKEAPGGPVDNSSVENSGESANNGAQK